MERRKLWTTAENINKQASKKYMQRLKSTKTVSMKHLIKKLFSCSWAGGGGGGGRGPQGWWPPPLPITHWHGLAAVHLGWMHSRKGKSRTSKKHSDQFGPVILNHIETNLLNFQVKQVTSLWHWEAVNLHRYFGTLADDDDEVMDEEIEVMMMNYCSRRLTCVLTLSGNRMIVPKDRRQDSENICSLVEFPRMSTGWKPLKYSFKGSY